MSVRTRRRPGVLSSASIPREDTGVLAISVTICKPMANLAMILTSALIANGGADVRKMMECAKQRVTTPKGVTPANVSRDITKTLLDSVKIQMSVLWIRLYATRNV